MVHCSRYRWCLLLAAMFCVVSATQAAEPRPFPEGRFGAGELKYIGDVPVLSVVGTPEEMGKQKGALTGEVVKKLVEFPKQLLQHFNHADRWPKLLEMSLALQPQLSEDYRAELRAFAKQAGVDRDAGMLANTMVDIYRGGFACSSLIVDPEHSAAGGPLFGRNLDFFTLNMLNTYGLVTVHRPKGKHAFASVGYPGLCGVVSGMNDAGLAVAVHEVFITRDGAPIFNPKGMPYTFCFRQILEDCTTIEEAEKLLRATERTTILSLAVCDRRNAAVLEMTPKTVAVRGPADGVLACTNHFRTDELSVWPMSRLCNRYPKLVQSRKLDRLGVDDVAKKMDEVNMGRMTVQTMIFEPAALKLHVSIGPVAPTSSQPLSVLDLGPLFAK